MQYNQKITINDLIEILRAQTKNIDFCVYGYDEPNVATLATTCVIGEPPLIDDDDNEIFPEYVTTNSLEFWYSDALLEDVVCSALNQKPQVTNSEILDSIKFYNENDSFLTL